MCNDLYEEIYQEVQQDLKLNIDCVFRLLAQQEHGQLSKKELTKDKKLFFCLQYGQYSKLDWGFIRRFGRRPDEKERDINIYVLQTIEQEIDRIRNNEQRTDLRNKALRNRDEFLQNQIGNNPQKKIELNVIQAYIQEINDRGNVSKTINLYIKNILGLSKTLPDPIDVIRELRKRCLQIREESKLK